MKRGDYFWFLTFEMDGPVSGVGTLPAADPNRELRLQLLERYKTAAAEYDEKREFKCRRCCKVVSWDCGGAADDLMGLCDDCAVEVWKVFPETKL